MLSKSSKYAIRAVLYLSVNSSENKKNNSKKIANAIDIPGPFLAKILQELTKRKLISSVKGRNGGFYLMDINRSNTLITIVEAIDGLDRFQSCLLGLPECSDSNPCSIHHATAPIRDTIIKEFSSKTIAEYTEELKQGKTHII